MQKIIEKLEETRKQDRLNVLNIYKKEFEIKEFSTLLRDLWIETEFPNQHPKYVLFELFKHADKNILIKGYEKEYKKLPNELRVYRGVQDIDSKKGKMKVKAFSWTTDINKARWFASRWRGDSSGKLWSALISKCYIFMFNDGRGEKEVVLNPDKLRNIIEMKGG